MKHLPLLSTAYNLTVNHEKIVLRKNNYTCFKHRAVVHLILLLMNIK